MTFTDKPKRKQAPTRPMQKFWLAGFVFLCAAMIGFILLTANADYVVCFDTPFPALEGVEHQAFFKLPPSAQNVEYAANGTGRKGGCTIWVSFEMNSEDVESFRASTHASSFQAEPLTETLLYFMQKQGWPRPAKTLLGHEFLAGQYPYAEQWIILDSKDAPTVRVYLIVNKEWL
jgi:hypothetical protein